MITDTDINKLSKKYQIDRYSIIKEYIQLVFLKYLYTDKTGNGIYFKGGTLIHLLLKSFRFSEDLDFSANIAVVQAEIPDITFELKKRWPDAFSGQIYYNIAGMKTPLTIKIEISGRDKPLTKAITLLETEFPIIPYPLIVHMDWEEVFAEKIRALIVRKKGRDLFDLWFLFSKEVPLNLEMVKKKLSFYDINPDLNIISELKKCITEFKDKKIEADLRKFLPLSHRNWLKQLKHESLKNIMRLESKFSQGSWKMRK